MYEGNVFSAPATVRGGTSSRLLFNIDQEVPGTGTRGLDSTHRRQSSPDNSMPAQLFQPTEENHSVLDQIPCLVFGPVVI